MTLGEYRVGILFNPSSNPQVDAIKRAAADLIDVMSDPNGVPDTEKFRMICNGIQQPPNIPERARLVGRALACISNAESTHAPLEMAKDEIENAAMWAVKAATKGPHE